MYRSISVKMARSDLETLHRKDHCFLPKKVHLLRIALLLSYATLLFCALAGLFHLRLNSHPTADRLSGSVMRILQDPRVAELLLIRYLGFHSHLMADLSDSLVLRMPHDLSALGLLLIRHLESHFQVIASLSIRLVSRQSQNPKAANPPVIRIDSLVSRKLQRLQVAKLLLPDVNGPFTRTPQDLRAMNSLLLRINWTLEQRGRKAQASPKTDRMSQAPQICRPHEKLNGSENAMSKRSGLINISEMKKTS